MDVSDKKLEKYMERLVASTNSKNKLVYYKRAVGRLNDLTQEYNDKCKLLVNDIEQLDNVVKLDDICIERAMIKLEEIQNMIDETTDLSTLIELYKQHTQLVSQLKIGYTEYTNQFNLIDVTNEIIQPLDINLILDDINSKKN